MKYRKFEMCHLQNEREETVCIRVGCTQCSWSPAYFFRADGMPTQTKIGYLRLEHLKHKCSDYNW